VDKTAFLARLPAVTPAASPGGLVGSLPAYDLVALFSSRLLSVDGSVHGPVPLVAVADLVVGIVAGSGADRYLGWDDPGAPAIHTSLRLAGVTRVEGWVPETSDERLQHLRSYHDIGIGVTGADAGLAESGSVILRSGPGRPRLAAVIPPVHVAVLPVSRIVRSLAQYLQMHPAALAGTSNLTIVTGPSRTGDIEQELNLGVHGPGQIHVILVA
jgi:L-lactate dehydrogenase complex protein LldG